MSSFVEKYYNEIKSIFDALSEYLFKLVDFWKDQKHYKRKTKEIMSSLKCQTHPNECINNFCRRKECMVGLCPTCVCQHTEFHHRHNTLPDYQTITSTYSVTEDMLHEYKVMLQQQKNKISQISESFKKRNVKTWEKFKQAKKECLDVVEKYFQELKLHFEQKINEEEMKTDIYNEDRFQYLQQTIDEEEIKLDQYLSELQNEKSPQLVKQIHTQLLPNTSKTLEQINNQVEKNNIFQPIFHFHKPILSEIKGAISRMANLQINYYRPALNVQKQQQQQQHQSRVSFRTPLKNHNVIRSSINKPIPQQVYNVTRSYIGPLGQSRISMTANNSRIKENSIQNGSRVFVNYASPLTSTF